MYYLCEASGAASTAARKEQQWQQRAGLHNVDEDDSSTYPYTRIVARRRVHDTDRCDDFLHDVHTRIISYKRVSEYGSKLGTIIVVACCCSVCICVGADDTTRDGRDGLRPALRATTGLRGNLVSNCTVDVHRHLKTLDYKQIAILSILRRSPSPGPSESEREPGQSNPPREDPPAADGQGGGRGDDQRIPRADGAEPRQDNPLEQLIGNPLFQAMARAPAVKRRRKLQTSGLLALGSGPVVSSSRGAIQYSPGDE
ncbi:unnamed protein product [Trichogramma brassicae]|uniref:Uncharacterized protein n=1 Tax=Trichogramma brassicae TaxID=86971 RepID=A0A6H5HWY3_9HYME|nr:unnamed protein product [Trichogramma brassicae]